MLAAQEWINRQLSHIEQGESAGLEARSSFEDMRALASWSLRRAEPGDFRSYGAHIAEQCQRHQNEQSFSPNPAAVAAGALTQAYEILRAPTSGHSVSVVRELLDRDAHAVDLLTPAEVRKRWREHSAELQETVWLAMDSRMNTVERLRYRSCTAHPRPPQHEEEPIAERARHMPELIWRSWAVRLLPHAYRSIANSRAALSVGLLLPGWSLSRFDPLIRMLHAQEHPDVHHVLNQVVRLHDDGLAVLCSIADYLDTGQCPIDYARRRATIASDLLPPEAWQQICSDAGTPSGFESRELVMRRYLYQRLTGNHHRHAPDELQIKSAKAEAAVAAVPFTLTSPLLEALDGYAADYLLAKGIEGEPPVWEPPAHLGMDLPLSQEIEDTLVRRAHQLICEDKVRPSSAAKQLGLPLNYVRYIFESQPPSPATPTPPGKRRKVSGSRRPPQLSEEFLRTEYLTKRKSILQISAETKVSAQAISEQVRQAGLAPLRHLHLNPIDGEWLQRQYLYQARSLADIAKEVGMSQTYVGNQLIAMGIELRHHRGRCTAISEAILEQVPPFLRPALPDNSAWERLSRYRAAMRHHTMVEAAQAVGVRPNLLYRQIAQLERQLGSALYVRVRRGVPLRPTPLGTKVLEALHDIERLRN